MTAIDDEIEAYERLQAKLEAEHMGQWVLIRDRELLGLFPSFELAAAEGVRQFGRSSYLIREIGAEPLRLPVSVVYHVWTPAVLTEYEVGRAILAAETIARSEKPAAEVGCQKVTSTVALEDDLRECVKLAGHANNVRAWTRATSGGRVRYGFYREEWVLDALDFLDRTDLSDVDRAWTSGLLYGYRSDAIQQFISRCVRRGPTPARSSGS